MSSANDCHREGEFTDQQPMFTAQQALDAGTRNVYRRMKKRMLMLLGGLAFVFLAIATTLRWLGAEGWLMSDVLWLLTASVLVALWAVYDHGHKSVGELDWDQMLFVFWPLTLLVWLLKTRGPIGGALYLGFWLLLLSPCVLPWLLFST